MIDPSLPLPKAAPPYGQPLSFQPYFLKILSALSTLVTTVIVAQVPTFGVTSSTHGTIDPLHGKISAPQLLSLSDSVPSPQGALPQDKQTVLSVLDTLRASADALPGELDRIYLLSKLAIAYDTWDATETAIALVDDAYAISQTTTDDLPVWELTAIAQASARVGRSDYAETFLDAALVGVDDAIEAVVAGTNDDARDEDLISWDLQQMVRAAAQMDDDRTAERILGAILDRLGEPLDDISQRRVLETVIETIEPWEDAAATRVFFRVHQAIEAIGQALALDSDTLSLPLFMDDLRDLQVAIASTAATFDDHTQAMSLLEALQNSEAITSSVPRAEVLNAIALAYSELGNLQQATAVLNDTVKLTQSELDDWQRLQILSKTVTVADVLGEDPQRDNLFRWALEINQTLPDNDETSASSIRLLAQAAVQYSDDQQATEVLQSLVPVAAAISWEGTRAGAFEHIVRASESLDDEVDTVQILNATLPFIDSLTENYSRNQLTSTIVRIATTFESQNAGSILQQIVQMKRNPAWTTPPIAWEDSLAWSPATGWTDPTGWVSLIRGVVQDLEHKQDPIAVLQSLRVTAQALPNAGAQATGLLLVAQGYERQDRPEEMVAVIQEVMDLLAGLPNDHAVRPQSMGKIMAMASGVNDDALARGMLNDAITYGNTLTTDEHKAKFIQAVAAEMPQWIHPQFALQADTLLSMGQTIQDPTAKLEALMAIATIYSHLDKGAEALDGNGNPSYNQRVIDLLEQSTSLVPTAIDGSHQQIYRQVAIAQQFADSGNQPQAKAILDQLYRPNPDLQAIRMTDDLFSLIQMLRGAIAIDSMDRAIAAMEPLITVADTLHREDVRLIMAEMDAAALEWEYQTSDPEEQLDRLWNESKTNIFIGMARTIVEEMAESEAKPQLASTFESAIAAADSITLATERFYALRAIGMAAVHTHNTDQAVLAFTLATSTFDDLEEVYAPMEALIETLEEYDRATVTTILSQVLEGLETQTVTDDIKVEVLWAIAHHLTDLNQPTATNED